MYVLGIHGGQKRDFEDNGGGYRWHDGAAVLVKDQEIVAAIEEERLNRVKHSNFFPAAAVRFCCERAGIGVESVDRIAVNLSQPAVEALAVERALASRVSPVTSGRKMIAGLFQEAFGVDVHDKIEFCHHHLAHAASAFYASGYDRALVITLDGDGDGLCGMVFVGDRGRLRKLKEFPDHKSLGNWYTAMIKILGYGRFDEYKVMGLAPYGDAAVYAPLFAGLYRLLPGGDYELMPMGRQLFTLAQAGLLDRVRRKGEAFTQVHKDFAAGLQSALEAIVLHIVRHFHHETRQRRLCLAGGVAHNCSMNGRLLYARLFDEVFVQPAAHDAGTALGAAWEVARQSGIAAGPGRMEHPFFGTEIGDGEEIRRRLESWRPFLDFERCDDLTRRTAQLLASGAVIGWAQGRSEFGPRALGNRSILADPRPADNKARINEMVKKREGYRPFAPSVVEERAAEFFETPDGQQAFPFMIFVLKVREQHRAALGAITHVDGTARVHTVAARTNPRYWELLHEFAKLTGLPILLNTSFNNNAEPIVDSIDDAIVCFLTTGLGYLAIGDFLVTKQDLAPADARYRLLAPRLRRQHKLVLGGAAAAAAGAAPHAVESTASEDFGEARAPISSDLYQVLAAAGGNRSLAELLAAAGIDDDGRRERVTAEAVELWRRRILVLEPSTAPAAPVGVHPGTA